MKFHLSRAQMLIGLLAVVLLSVGGWWLWEKFSPPKPFGKVVTLAGAGIKIGAQQMIADPFGVAADDDGNIYVTDGLGGRLYKVTAKGEVALITDQLDMPSHLAVAPDGSLVVANTGANRIVRVNPKSGELSMIAIDQAGIKGPIGVAVDRTNAIIFSNTYAQQIHLISKNKERVFGSPQPVEPKQEFDTPCGVALMEDGAMVVADTGNHRICRIAPDGSVTTVAGNGEANEKDGALLEASFNEPMAIAVAGENSFYVADAAGSAIRFVNLGGRKPERPPASDGFDAPGVYTVAGGISSGLVDGELKGARFNRPTGIALVGKNMLVVADSGAGLIRALIPANANIGIKSDPSIATIKAEEIRCAVPPRWPYDPPQNKREIAGTLGEVRGEIAPEKDAWFHNGLDVPGAYGEQVRAVYSERITRPLAVEGVGGLRERLRLPLLGYIHVKIARDQNDQPLGIKAAIFQRDEKGKITGIRLPRGTRINAGDVIGTLNSFNHVHLIAGPAAAEVNALAALELPGLIDTVAPTIEGLRLLTEQGEELKAPFQVSSKIKFIVRAYDQVDGNVGYRKLGVYRVGYQLLKQDGSLLPDFKEPRFNIEFNRLPEDPMAARIAYAEPSQSGYTGKTMFDYIATNIVRDGRASEDWLDTTKLASGEYILRAVVEDFFGNRTTKDVRIQYREP